MMHLALNFSEDTFRVKPPQSGPALFLMERLEDPIKILGLEGFTREELHVAGGWALCAVRKQPELLYAFQHGIDFFEPSAVAGVLFLIVEKRMSLATTEQSQQEEERIEGCDNEQSAS
jgi:hypothetical protein